LTVKHTQTTPRFDVNDPNAYTYFEENGYVVIKDVIPKNDIDLLQNMMWNWLQQLKFPNGKRIKRNDPTTWNDGNWPSDPDTGIIFSFGVGQSDFMWKMRCYPKIKEFYKRIHKTNDLICSLDGCNVYRPWKYNKNWKTKGKWWHLDQNGRREDSQGFQCAQGIVSLMDSNEYTGGLIVLPKSHKKHQEICDRIGYPKHTDYIPIPKNDYLFSDPDFKDGGIFVHSKAGDLTLWDSRTVHCNGPGIKESNKTHQLLRMTLYICMTPRWQCKQEILKRRQQIAFDLHCTSTHWPQFFVYRLGSAYVKHNFRLNEYQKQLLGYPRNNLMQFWWKCENEYNIGFKHILLCGYVVIVIKMLFWNKSRKK